MTVSEHGALIFLSHIPFLGPHRLEALLLQAGSAQRILESTISDLRTYGAGEELASHWFSQFHDPKWKVATESVLSAEARGDFQATTWADAHYPPLLRELPGAPPVLYSRGQWPSQEKTSLGIVGSRKPSSYGVTVTETFAAQFARQQVIVVSGLARGIDTCAHHAVLKVGGFTVAVLGNGLGYYYPRDNRRLQDQIAQEGLVISEYSYLQAPRPEQFPRRNRIIAGLSQGILVVEASRQSGALITAKLAAEAGRDVFAVPGSIYNPVSGGCHFLIKEGAQLVTSPEEIFPSGKPVPSKEQAQEILESLTEPERCVVKTIGVEGASVDELAQDQKISFSELSRILLELELRGIIRALPGQRYGLAKEIR